MLVFCLVLTVAWDVKDILHIASFCAHFVCKTNLITLSQRAQCYLPDMNHGNETERILAGIDSHQTQTT